MVVFPFCKVNIGLSVVERRNDGYHNIESLFYPVDLTDILEVVESDDGKNHFVMTGLSLDGDPSQNLCVKAYDQLSKEFLIPPVRIHLHKNIPAGAGLGGGSSDAAFMLRCINELFDLEVSKEDLFLHAMQIGSDCGFFMQDSPAIVKGRGESLSPLNISLSNYKIVIIKPDIHIKTANAYAGIVPGKSEYPIAGIISRPVSEWQGNLINDFEQNILKNHPKINDIKTKLQNAGALFVSMTGSGSAVYGIFEKGIQTSMIFPGCFTWSGILS
jgi:4-diphosphocytidyl-2-C-methyl-D-erythritol kinase